MNNAENKLNKETIKQIALANGFKLKEQANGDTDLNPYVYEFTNAIAEHCWSAFKSGVMPHKIHPTKASLNNGWISVDDGLPEPEIDCSREFKPTKFYLIQLKNGLIDIVAFVNIYYDAGDNRDEFVVCTINSENNKYVVQEYFQWAYDVDEVKYWQPLPNPPKE